MTKIGKFWTDSVAYVALLAGAGLSIVDASTGGKIDRVNALEVFSLSPVPEPAGYAMLLAGVGLLAGFLASSVAVAVGWALARYVFQFSWTASPWVPLGGAVAGAVLALVAGWWGLRSVLRTPVVETLRKAAA